MDRVGLLKKIDEDPLFLSRGEKRRLALASVIAMKPKILIIDEPTTGQDYRMSREIMDILTEMNKEGTTIIVITHDMRLVAEYCRRVLVMKRGRIIFDGKPENLFENEDLLNESSLISPREVKLSKRLMEKGIMQELLLSAREWLEFLKFESEKKRYVFLSYHFNFFTILTSFWAKNGSPLIFNLPIKKALVPSILPSIIPAKSSSFAVSTTVGEGCSPITISPEPSSLNCR